ncbi:MAG TPA: hypothetical protein VFX16_09520 [Pseudonocardiaceae bacterium]|nr:hypothetical protein [Pseudonocardiaceae bacterium]
MSDQRQNHDPYSSGQGYDPYKLVDDVIEVLVQHGLSPDRSHGSTSERITGASMLLRNLGVAPLRAPEDAVDLDGGLHYDSRMHGD